MTKLGKKLIAAAKEGVALARGEVTPLKTKRDYRMALKETRHSWARSAIHRSAVVSTC